MRKSKWQAGEKNAITIFIGGIIGSCLMLVVLSFVMAIIAGTSSDPTGSLGVYSLAALILSAAISGFTVSRVKGEGGFKVSVLCSLATALIMLLMGVILGDGKLSGASFMNYGCYFAISAFAAYLGKKREKRRRRSHR